MISQVLAKVRASQGLGLTLIAPFWPQRLWFPELLILPLFLFHLGGIFCVDHTSEDSTKTCPCFVFMRGDSQEICESLRLLSLRGWTAWAGEEAVFSNQLPVKVAYLSSSVYGQGAFGVPTLDLEGCGLPCLALGGSRLVSVFGQGPPLYAVVSFSVQASFAW